VSLCFRFCFNAVTDFAQDEAFLVPCIVAVSQNIAGEFPQAFLLQRLLILKFVQFEDLISSTIEETKDIPEVMSETGKIGMPHKGLFPSRCFHLYVLILVAEIMQKIGQLFLLRTNINTVGSVLDSPVSLDLMPFHFLTHLIECRKSSGFVYLCRREWGLEVLKPPFTAELSGPSALV
jgi:hypothetical protein